MYWSIGQDLNLRGLGSRPSDSFLTSLPIEMFWCPLQVTLLCLPLIRQLLYYCAKGANILFTTWCPFHGLSYVALDFNCHVVYVLAKMNGFEPLSPGIRPGALPY